jgi:hypothetical protein
MVMKSKNKINNGLILMIFFCGMSLLNACKTKGLAAFPPADSNQKEKVSVNGTIQKQGITTYQYGTHVLLDKDGKTLYALKSETLKLDDYIGKKVELEGKLVEDYPVDGGPSYLEVMRIKE